MSLVRFANPLASTVFLGALLTIMFGIPSDLSAQPIKDEFGTLPILSASSASVAGRVPAMGTSGPECSTADAPAIAGIGQRPVASEPAPQGRPVGEGSRPPSGSSLDCPEGVWLHDHAEDNGDDYGDGVGVTWCRLTREYEVTVGIFYTVTSTWCEYGGCDLQLEEAEAHMGGSH